MQSETIIVKRVPLSEKTSQIIEIDYDKIFNDIPETYEVVRGTEKYTVDSMLIIYTAELRKISPLESLDIEPLFGGG